MRPSELLTTFAGSRSARQSALLMSSQGISMVLSFAFTVLIARSLSVADYGSFRYAMTFLAMMMTVLQVGWPYSAARLLAMEHDTLSQRQIVGAAAVLLVISSGIGTVGTLLVFRAATFAGHILPAIVLSVGRRLST